MNRREINEQQMEASKRAVSSFQSPFNPLLYMASITQIFGTRYQQRCSVLRFQLKRKHTQKKKKKRCVLLYFTLSLSFVCPMSVWRERERDKDQKKGGEGGIISNAFMVLRLNKELI